MLEKFTRKSVIETWAKFRLPVKGEKSFIQATDLQIKSEQKCRTSEIHIGNINTMDDIVLVMLLSTWAW